MRELIRFGEDFHDTCSIRSKLVKTKVISQQLDKLLSINSSILGHEKKVLEEFSKKRTRVKSKHSQMSLLKRSKSTRNRGPIELTQELRAKSIFSLRGEAKQKSVQVV